MLTIKEVAAYLRFTTTTVYRMAQLGKIPAFRVGRQWRFKKEEVDEWLRQKQSPAQDESR